ncbi:CLUMA_CG011221, isoform A [Clunio marinus]|uniref:CLUMA_CG011221, isoform A n=1 Tax=Clunio marinus TaxID=568069 RepID=A0A1J1IC40_9DIPT|nr:CLUMA_CG011221, isoform A [Clunio marinus]
MNTEGTPFEDFIKSRQLLDAKYPIEHTADVLRVLLLWKFGGTYTDTDTITRLPFDTLEPNFACQENEKYVVNGVWNMESADRSPLATLFAEHLTKNYDATTWAKNGPGLVTAVVSKLCGTESVTQMIAKKECEGFHVLPRKVCYPILYDEKSKLFNSSNADEIMTRVNESVSVHFWNKHTKNVKIERTEESACIRLAKQFCPKTMSIDRIFF